MQDKDEEEPDVSANRAREVLITAADKHLRRKKRRRQHWISDKTLEKIEERRKLKGKSDLISKQKYKQLNKEIRSLCRADKTKYIITKCNNIRKHQLINNSRAMFQIHSIARKLREDVEWAIKSLKDGKEPGCDR